MIHHKRLLEKFFISCKFPVLQARTVKRQTPCFYVNRLFLKTALSRSDKAVHS